MLLQLQSLQAAVDDDELHRSTGVGTTYGGPVNMDAISRLKRNLNWHGCKAQTRATVRTGQAHHQSTAGHTVIVEVVG